MHSAAPYRKIIILSSIENREPFFSSDYCGQWKWEFLFIGRNILGYTFSQVESILKQGNVKNIDSSKCGNKRWRVLGSMVLAHQTKRPPQWTKRNAGLLCKLFTLHKGAEPNVQRTRLDSDESHICIVDAKYEVEGRHGNNTRVLNRK